MPTMRRVTIEQVSQMNKFEPGTQLTAAQFYAVRDLWIAPNGNAYFAGYYGHEESARTLGYKTTEDCEDAGYIHISSCLNGMPTIFHAPRKINNRQYNTLADFYNAHGMHAADQLDKTC